MIINFEEYINEANILHKIGVATGLSKPDDDIIKRIIRMIRKLGVDEGRYKIDYPDNADDIWRPSRIYNYVIMRTPGKARDIDPYGEEEWDDDKPIRIRMERHDYDHRWEHYYNFYVNDRKLDVSDPNVETLIELLERPGKIRQQQREKEAERAKRKANDDLRKELL